MQGQRCARASLSHEAAARPERRAAAPKPLLDARGLVRRPAPPAARCRRASGRSAGEGSQRSRSRRRSDPDAARIAAEAHDPVPLPKHAVPPGRAPARRAQADRRSRQPARPRLAGRSAAGRRRATPERRGARKFRGVGAEQRRMPVAVLRPVHALRVWLRLHRRSPRTRRAGRLGPAQHVRRDGSRPVQPGDEANGALRFARERGGGPVRPPLLGARRVAAHRRVPPDRRRDDDVPPGRFRTACSSGPVLSTFRRSFMRVHGAAGLFVRNSPAAPTRAGSGSRPPRRPRSRALDAFLAEPAP